MSAVVLLAILIAVVVLVALPSIFLVRRFRNGDEAVAGGSMGRQLVKGKEDDWGPKPTPPPG